MISGQNLKILALVKQIVSSAVDTTKLSLQAGIEFKKNLRVRFGKYGGLKLEYFWVVKSKKVKSFIRG